MAILEIRKFNDKVLKKRARKVRKVDEEIRELIVNMAQTMAKGQGIGLAAPQIGVLRRIIVVHGDFKGQRILGLINPKITKMSKEKEKDMEGCLSFPAIILEILPTWSRWWIEVPLMSVRFRLSPQFFSYLLTSTTCF